MTKRIVKRELRIFSPYDFDGNLGDILSEIQDLVDLYGKDVRLDFEPDFYYPYESSPSPRFVIYGNREETDAEYATRLDREATEKARQDARDLAEFNRLKSKFST